MRSELNETPSLIRSFRRLRIPSIVFTCKRAARLSSPSHRRLRFVREAGLLPRPGFAVNIFFSSNRPASPPSDPPHLPARSAVSTVFTKPCQPLFFGSFQKLTASSSHLPHHPSGLQRSAVSTELNDPCQPLFSGLVSAAYRHFFNPAYLAAGGGFYAPQRGESTTFFRPLLFRDFSPFDGKSPCAS